MGYAWAVMRIGGGWSRGDVKTGFVQSAGERSPPMKPNSNTAHVAVSRSVNSSAASTRTSTSHSALHETSAPAGPITSSRTARRAARAGYASGYAGYARRVAGTDSRVRDLMRSAPRRANHRDRDQQASAPRLPLTVKPKQVRFGEACSKRTLSVLVRVPRHGRSAIHRLHCSGGIVFNRLDAGSG